MKGSFCLTYEPEQQNNNIVRRDENSKQETMECHFFFSQTWATKRNGSLDSVFVFPIPHEMKILILN